MNLNQKLWSGIRVKYINFQTKHILRSIKHILIFRTYIIQFSRHTLAYTKHILILRTDVICFFKQVLIFPYRYYSRYRCYRTCQQELSCIKQSGQSYETYIQNSTRQGEMNIIFEVSPDDSWCNLEAMSVFLVFVILPTANIQIAIFVVIWWQNGKTSINDLSPINKSVSKVDFSVIPFRSSFRQNFRSLKA